MSRYKPAEAKAVSTSYQAFLWQEIKDIRTAEKEGDPLTALILACSLVKYLSIQVKDSKDFETTIVDDVKEVAKEINKRFKIEASDFHSTMLARSKQTTALARVYLNEFMDKLTRLLDKSGVYMEYRSREIPTGKEIDATS